MTNTPDMLIEEFNKVYATFDIPAEWYDKEFPKTIKDKIEQARIERFQLVLPLSRDKEVSDFSNDLFELIQSPEQYESAAIKFPILEILKEKDLHKGVVKHLKDTVSVYTNPDNKNASKMAFRQATYDMFIAAALLWALKSELLTEEELKTKVTDSKAILTFLAPFVEALSKHVVEYTIPQYKDMPDDLIQKYPASYCMDQAMRYISRMDSNARGAEEEVRDLLKIAHYSVLAHMKFITSMIKLSFDLEHKYAESTEEAA